MTKREWEKQQKILCREVCVHLNLASRAVQRLDVGYPDFMGSVEQDLDQLSDMFSDYKFIRGDYRK
jgi:hypothetical protein